MFSPQPNKITIYTDGSSRGNPGRGGYGCIIVFANETMLEIGGKDSHTTNNKMELQAAIEGLKNVLSTYTKVYKNIHVFSDSKYVLQGITTWIHGWKKNNWRTSSKAPVLNKELWQELDNVRDELTALEADIEWSYVKGHSDNPWNARADEIATTCADAADGDLCDKGKKVFYDGIVAAR